MQAEIRHSGIWQLSSTVLPVGDGCIVVDPGYFPRELEELVSLCRRHGGARAVVFTHGHWDHVIGWSAFPDAVVWVSPSLAEAMRTGSAQARKNLADAREFDGRWYIERPVALGWPPDDRVVALADDGTQRIGAVDIRSLLLPGHSPDGVALLVAEAGLLLVGDYLSPCEIPFVEDLHAYCATLERLLLLLDGDASAAPLAAADPAGVRPVGEIHQVIPGHGPALSAAQARQIAADDLSYLQALRGCAEARDLQRALALPLPRAATVPGMTEHHRENCQAAGLIC